MRRRAPVVVDDAGQTDDNARRRARNAWARGYFEAPRICSWEWPTDRSISGRDLLDRVVADYEAAGREIPIGSYVEPGPYLLPGES